MLAATVQTVQVLRTKSVFDWIANSLPRPLLSTPQYLNTASNLIRAGLFSFEGYHTHELL